MLADIESQGRLYQYHDIIILREKVTASSASLVASYNTALQLADFFPCDRPNCTEEDSDHSPRVTNNSRAISSSAIMCLRLLANRSRRNLNSCCWLGGATARTNLALDRGLDSWTQYWTPELQCYFDVRFLIHQLGLKYSSSVGCRIVGEIATNIYHVCNS